MIVRKNSNALIEIDGGVTLDNYKKLLQCGADVLVAGNTVFNAADKFETVKKLKQY